MVARVPASRSQLELASSSSVLRAGIATRRYLADRTELARGAESRALPLVSATLTGGEPLHPGDFVKSLEPSLALFLLIYRAYLTKSLK